MSRKGHVRAVIVSHAKQRQRDMLRAQARVLPKAAPTGGLEEVRGTVGRLNDCIVSHAGVHYSLQVRVARYGRGSKMTSVVGYTYKIRVDGALFVGTAQGPGALITLRRV